MEIPQTVRDKLKCSECDEYLSCGPVYLLHENEITICGRCSQQSDENDFTESTNRTRNEPYEAAASILAFPCTNASRGCPEYVKFTLGQPPHELSCEFRQFICSVAPQGSCNWIGSSSKFKEHPLNVLENPCCLPRLDLTNDSLQSYVISAFNLLFLLQIKVCLISQKLFHSVRMFGNSDLFDKFSFDLIIEGIEMKIINKGSIQRAGVQTIKESTSVFITINSLLEFLSYKYNESKFTIKIHGYIRKCLNCLTTVENVTDSKYCDECEGKLVKCKFSENCCSFVDVLKEKCEKHELCFCKYQTKCLSCEVNLVEASFVEHLDSSTSCSQILKSENDSVNRLTNTNSQNKYILLSIDHLGTVICSYNLSASTLMANLRTSLPSYDLKNFKCSIELTDPETNHTQMLTPEIQYDCLDWSIEEKMNNFPSWENTGIDIKININKSL